MSHGLQFTIVVCLNHRGADSPVEQESKKATWHRQCTVSLPADQVKAWDR